jgi:transcriptional regulator with XRE-family HTH domain
MTDQPETPTPSPAKGENRFRRARAARPGEIPDADVAIGDSDPVGTGASGTEANPMDFLAIARSIKARREQEPPKDAGEPKKHHFPRAKLDPTADPERPNRFRRAFLWSQRPGFGPYLRRIRTEKGMSLRGAARELDVSFNYLNQIETGGRHRPPSPSFIQSIADLFGRDVSEVMREAGFDTKVPDGLRAQERVDQEFRRLMTHPRLRPLRMEPTALDFYSPLQKLQVLELVAKIERLHNDDRRTVRDLLGPDFGDSIAVRELRDHYADFVEDDEDELFDSEDVDEDDGDEEDDDFGPTDDPDEEQP